MSWNYKNRRIAASRANRPDPLDDHVAHAISLSRIRSISSLSCPPRCVYHMPCVKSTTCFLVLLYTEGVAAMPCRFHDWLPNELIRYILTVRAVLRIQRQFRKLCMKHTQHPRWIELRRALITCVDDNIDILTRCRQVRREWCQEPESWIFELQHDLSSGKMILEEVKQGLWGVVTPRAA